MSSAQKNPRRLLQVFCLGLGVILAELATGATLSGESLQAAPGAQNLALGFDLEVVTGERVAAVQFELVMDPSAIVFVGASAGPVAVAAGKSLSLNTLADGRFRVIIAGFNQNEIDSGRLLDTVLHVQPGAPGGVQAIRIERLVISNPNGTPVVAEGENGAIEVLRPPGGPEQCGCSGAPNAPGGAFSLGDMLVLLAMGLFLARSLWRSRQYSR